MHSAGVGTCGFWIDDMFLSISILYTYNIRRRHSHSHMIDSLRTQCFSQVT